MLVAWQNVLVLLPLKAFLYYIEIYFPLSSVSHTEITAHAALCQDVTNKSRVRMWVSLYVFRQILCHSYHWELGLSCLIHTPILRKALPLLECEQADSMATTPSWHLFLDCWLQQLTELMTMMIQGDAVTRQLRFLLDNFLKV